MTRQFKYPEGHAELAKPPMATLTAEEIYGLPTAVRGLAGVDPCERYSPTVVGYLVYGRGR